MHLVHSPLCVPEGYLEKFSFIKDADDNAHHDRQYVAAMVNYMDDVVGNVVSALQVMRCSVISDACCMSMSVLKWRWIPQDAKLWENTLLVWSSVCGVLCNIFVL